MSCYLFQNLKCSPKDATDGDEISISCTIGFHNDNTPCCLSSSPHPSLLEIMHAFHWRQHLLHMHCKHHTPPFPSHMMYPIYARLRLTMDVSFFLHSHHNPHSQPKYYLSSIHQSSTTTCFVQGF